MLLAIDTATATASLALYDPASHTLISEQTWQARRRQTHDLIPAARRMFDFLEIEVERLTALAVTTGPGSFTGVRIGISTVKGMALGLAQPPHVVGVPTLTVTAAPWLQAAWSISPAPIVCAYIQAGRGRYNWCFFGPEDTLFRPAAEDHGAGDAGELAQLLADHRADNIWLVGEADELLAESVGSLSRVTLFDSVSAQRRAGTLARLADLFMAEGVNESADSLQPLYLRAP